jgi:hypothetical protein
LAEPLQINIFTAGLRDPLKTNVELQKPATLEEAMALARAYENRLAMVTDTTTCSGSRLAFNRTKQLALPAPTATTGSTTATPPTAAPEPRFKRLTMAEMAAKRARGECYNCTEKFTKEHLEICPVKAIFLLELDTLSASETMKLFIRLGAATIMALLDSCSTHSFISTEVVCRLHLEPVYQPGLQVTVANGDKVGSTDVCRNVQFFIDQEAFVMVFFIIDYCSILEASDT